MRAVWEQHVDEAQESDRSDFYRTLNALSAALKQQRAHRGMASAMALRVPDWIGSLVALDGDSTFSQRFAL